MEYNTQRGKLFIREYGRNTQKLIKYLTTIEDKQKRTKFARTIIQIMAQMNPGARETGDFRHKLWDHLYIMSDFQLDVECPYPLPTKDLLVARPERIKYSDRNIEFKMYGSNIKRIIDAAKKYEDGPEKDALVHAIANHLKKSYLNWNRESVADDLIFQHLEKLSDGKLRLNDELTLNKTSEILGTTTKPKKKKKPTKAYVKKGGKPKPKRKKRA
jgi:hypothetical protein